MVPETGMSGLMTLSAPPGAGMTEMNNIVSSRGVFGYCNVTKCLCNILASQLTVGVNLSTLLHQLQFLHLPEHIALEQNEPSHMMNNITNEKHDMNMLCVARCSFLTRF